MKKSLLLLATAALTVPGAAFAADETNRELAITYANFHVQRKDYAAADRALSDHLRTDAQDSEAWNILGLVRIKAGNPTQAVEAFARAASVTGAPSHGIYLYNYADALSRSGDEARARKSLEEASSDAAVGSSARQALEELKPGRSLPELRLSPPARWNADMTVATGYDTNVLLFSDTTLASITGTGTASPFFLLAPRVSHSGDALGGRLDSDASVTFLDETGSSASAFNNLSVSAGSRLARPDKSFGLFHSYLGRLDYSMLNLSGLEFFHWSALAGWRGVAQHRKGSETYFELPLRYQKFHTAAGDDPANDRTGPALAPTIGHRHQFGELDVDIALQFEKLFSRGANFHSTAFRVPLSLTHPLPWDLTGTLGLEVARIRYPDSSAKRADTSVQGSLVLSRRLFDRLNGILSYSYTKNSSNTDTAAYTKNSVALLVTYALL